MGLVDHLDQVENFMGRDPSRDDLEDVPRRSAKNYEFFLFRLVRSSRVTLVFFLETLTILTALEHFTASIVGVLNNTLATLHTRYVLVQTACRVRNSAHILFVPSDAILRAVQKHNLLHE